MTDYYISHHLSKTETLPKEVMSHIDWRNTILDVGCGNGALKELFPSNQIVGVDSRRESIRVCEKAGYWKVKQVDIDKQKLPFRANSFDVIICRQVLEHLYYPLFATREMWRVMKPRGFLFVSVPTPKNRKYFDDYSHVRPFTEYSLTMLLKDAGFKRISPIYALRGIPGASLIRPEDRDDIAVAVPWLREQSNVEVIARV